MALPKDALKVFKDCRGIARSTVNSIVGNTLSPESVQNANTSQNQGPPSSPPSAAQYFNNNYAVGALSETLDFVVAIVKLAVNLPECIATAGALCSDAIWSAVDVVVQGIQLSGYIAYNELNLGVAYESGGADYAEWLRLAYEDEPLAFGDVVGIKGGLISKTFKDAESFQGHISISRCHWSHARQGPRRSISNDCFHGSGTGQSNW